MCHGFVFLNLVSPRRPFTLLYGQHMCSLFYNHEMSWFCGDCDWLPRTNPTANRQESAKNCCESIGALQFVSVSEKPGSACRVSLQSSSVQQRDPGRANKQRLAAPGSQVHSYWNKQLLMWSRDMCMKATLALAVCSYPLLFHHAVTPKGQWVLFFFSSSVLFEIEMQY